MKKKKGGGGGANWMDTYGDMVTLLLCFFVLLYSMSTISEDKWRAIVTSFNPFAILDSTENSGNDGPVADPDDNKGGVPTIPNVAAQREIDADIEDLYVMLVQFAQSNAGMEEALNIEKGGGKVYISLNQNVMFAPEKPDILPAGEEILLQIAGMLDQVKDSIEEVRIQGHTARYVYDRPNPEYYDWRLSSNRALNVQYFLYQNSSIHGSRLVAESMGQWRPEGDNKNEAGRAINRRVVLIVSGRNIEEELQGNSVGQLFIDKLGETS